MPPKSTRLTNDGADSSSAAALLDSVVSVPIDTTDPHLVKFVEACLREHALNPTPVYIHAANAAVDVLKDHLT